MEYILYTLIAFICVNTAIKLSFWKWWQVIVFAAIASAFLLLVYPFASEQSKVQLMAYTKDLTVMQNIAVLITLEGVIMIGFTFLQLRKIWGKIKRIRFLSLLKYYPGLLIFPALFYLLAQSFFSFSGVSFTTIGIVAAALVFLLLPAVTLGLKLLIPEKELRLELLFLTTLFLCAIGLIATVDGKTVYTPVQQDFDGLKVALALGLFLLFFISGYLANKWRWRYGAKRHNKKNKII